MWYLPVDDIQTLPREGIDELPKEQKPEVFKIPATPSVGMPKTPPSYKLNVKPVEWSKEDEKIRLNTIRILESASIVPQGNGKVQLRFSENILWLQSLPERFNPQPHWKPTTEHLSALSDVLEESKGNRLAVLKDLYNHIKEL